MEDTLNQYVIGSGAGFPIELTKPLDDNGNIQQIYNDDGVLVDLVTWSPLIGSFDLIKQNIIAILNTPLGFQIRNEFFGSRINEVIEEPNAQAANYLLITYIKESIEIWEPRVKISKIETTYKNEYVTLKLRLSLIETGQESEFEINYNPTNNSIYGNE